MRIRPICSTMKSRPDPSGAYVTYTGLVRPDAMVVSLNVFRLTDVVVGVNGDGDGLGDADAVGPADGLAAGVGLPTAEEPGPEHAASSKTARHAPIDLTNEKGAGTGTAGESLNSARPYHLGRESLGGARARRPGGNALRGRRPRRARRRDGPDRHPGLGPQLLRRPDGRRPVPDQARA